MIVEGTDFQINQFDQTALIFILRDLDLNRNSLNRHIYPEWNDERRSHYVRLWP